MNLKHPITRILFLLLTSMMLIFASGMTAFAVKAPDQVQNITAVAGESRVSFTWKKVKKADGYEFTIKNAETKELVKTVRVKDGNKTKATLKRLENGVTYSITIKAYRFSGNKRIYGEKSKKFKVTPMIIKPAQPSVKLYSVSDGKVVFTWDAAAYATYYCIYQRDADGKYQKIGTTKKNQVSIKGLKNNNTYTFRIYSFRKVDGKVRYSEGYTISATPRTIENQVSDIIVGYKKAAIMAVDVTTSKLNTTQTITIPAGTRVCVVSRGVSDSTIQTADGSRALVSNGTYYYSTSNPIAYNSDTPYSARIAETFVNSVKQLTSSSQYLLWVNIYTQHMYVFTSTKASNGKYYGWKLKYSWPCITGGNENKTWTGTASNPNGICTLFQRIGSVETRGKLVFVDGGSFGYWATWLSNLGNAIHSWRYWSHLPGDVLVDGTELGKPISNGCIRLAIQNAEFTYKEVPLGTTVMVN